MSTSKTAESQIPSALSVNSTDDTLSVELSDGRSISTPLAWYPRLLHATKDERDNWRLIAGGQGIHWPELDEDISIENLLAGKASGESQRSFQRWLDGRRRQPGSEPT